MRRPGRVVHFGIDGGSFGVLDRLAARGLMPRYAELRRSGGRALLRSTIPWFTVPAWTTWMTGVSAQRHGLIYWTASAARDLWDRRGEQGRFVSASDIAQPTIFEMLSYAGGRVASVNMPVTYPPPRLDGVIVPGFLAPMDGREVAHPPRFLERYPGYRIDVEQGPPSVMGAPAGEAGIRGEAAIAAYVDRLTDMAAARHRIVLDLLHDAFTFVSVVYVGADRISHVAWPQVERILERGASSGVELAVERYYATLDRLLGETLDAERFSLFVVTSDHGQGAPPARTVAPNTWLREQGWLSVRHGSLTRTAGRAVPAQLRRRLWRLWGRARRARGLPSGAAPFVDWDDTVAYAFPMSHCTAFGVALRADGGLRDDVVAGLYRLRDADTGAPVVDRVISCEDECEGRALRTYPDLLALTRPGYGSTKAVDGPLVRPELAGASGYHEKEGMLVALGDGVAPGDHSDASIADVAPTVLVASGVEPPPYMDGSAIPWICSGSGSRRPAAVGGTAAPRDGLSSEDERAIGDHLRSLGYVE